MITAPDIDRSIEVAYIACISILNWHLAEPSPFYTDEEIAEELVRMIAGFFLTPTFNGL